MTVPARHARAKSSAYRDADCEDEFDSREFYSGERVCPPPAALGGNDRCGHVGHRPLCAGVDQMRTARRCPACRNRGVVENDPRDWRRIVV